MEAVFYSAGFEVGEKTLAGVKRGQELDVKKGEDVGGVEERRGIVLQPATQAPSEHGDWRKVTRRVPGGHARLENFIGLGP
ncbi:hypothetical protein AMTR_s00003p00269420 [Amborella trichopoda]|uniref:Uncharacterized protein n=1 Tax=Amborella trichopoda TaxID=13333 RepID=W1P917_AMBTC|nr:hypothetical protein AMTR_s00003p00269420 [Amborella trichopoda]